MSDSGCLRLLTCLVPGLPLSLYQTYQYYLEEALGIPVQLIVESRWDHPNNNGQDPFTHDQVDIAFLHTSTFLQLSDKASIELLPVAPVHNHPRALQEPVYFSQVIVHADNSDKFTDFADLHGYRWGYSDDQSISSSLTTQAQLRKLATDVTFFRETVRTGCDITSIKRILSYDLDGAAVDSNSLECFLQDRPDARDKIKIICTWGPIPVQPIVVNSKLSDDLKSKLSSSLLGMNKISKWQEQLANFNIWGFKPNNIAAYDDIKLAIKERKHKVISTATAYY